VHDRFVKPLTLWRLMHRLGESALKSGVFCWARDIHSFMLREYANR